MAFSRGHFNGYYSGTIRGTRPRTAPDGNRQGSEQRRNDCEQNNIPEVSVVNAHFVERNI